MRKCPQCDRDNLEIANYCDNCGQRLRNRREEASINALASSAYLDVEILNKRYDIFPDNDVLIGRGDADRGLYLDIMIPERDASMRGVSRIHAKIFCHDNTYYVADLDSTNAVRLNGEKLVPQAPYRLKDGDGIELGLLPIRFVVNRD